MSKIDFDRLFAADGGERYILKYYPDAAKSFRDPRIKFKTREEKTASASLKRMASGEWGVTDFGGDGVWRNAIKIAMLEEGWEWIDALRDVCRFYDYQDEFQNFAPKAQYEKRAALPNEGEGFYSIKPKEFTIDEIRTVLMDSAWHALGNTDEIRKERAQQLFAIYHFKCLESYSTVYEGQHQTTSSTDTYPIFCFDEGDFKKIYRPKAEHKNRFRYLGKKPAHYVHGLKQHQEFVTQLKRDKYDKEAKEKAAEHDTSEEFAPTKEQIEKEVEHQKVKLSEIIICSGGSDALNCAALGYRVIWMNSESESLTGEDMSAVLKLSEKVYNIPDIDRTGRVTGHALASKYLNLYTIWLPDKIFRADPITGKATSKDLRDYLKTHNKKNFDRLLTTALPYRFWDEENQVDDKGKIKFKFGRPLIAYKFNHVQAYNFLYRSGFARIKSERDKDGFFYVQVVGNVVKQIDAQDIKGYLHAFLEERWQFDDQITQDLLNSMYTSNQLSINNLGNLPLIELDFKSYGPDHQYFFFPNCTWKITADGIEETKGLNTPKYVWEDKVITYPTKNNANPNVKKLDPLFRISKLESGEYDIEVLSQDCDFLNFQINTARVHWRKELEDRQTLWATHSAQKKKEDYILQHGLTDQETNLFFQTRDKETQLRYLAENKFNIAGPLLTDAERKEQKQHLVNRIFVLGYMLHRYKSPSRAWAVWAMDNKLSEMQGDDAKSNGGSGKSLTGKALKWIWRYNVSFSGRNPMLTKNPHIYDKVTRHTDLLIFDDCFEYLDFGFFFGDITGDMNPNPKNAQSYNIPFDESPKFWFDSNFGDRDFSESTQRRKVVTSFSDYYHERGEGSTYKETRMPIDDFDGRQLFYDFDQNQWNQFFNFMAQCLHFYLTATEKIKPPMNNIQKRNLLSAMGGRFFEWAEIHFGPESGRLDKAVCKEYAKEAYMKSEQIRELSTQKFTDYCKKYAAYHSYEFNPADLQNSQGRIIRDFDGGKKEAIYFRTRPDQATPGEQPANPTQPTITQTGIHFGTPGEDNDDMLF